MGKECSIDGCGKSVRARGLCGAHYEKWRIRGDPEWEAGGPKGWVTPNGYRARSTKKADGCRSNRLEHILVAEKAIGKPLPEGAVVHHVDGDKLNNNPENLLVCPDQDYHLLMHRRQEAMEATGDPDKRRCKFCKEWDRPENLRVYTASREGRGKETPNIHHPKCNAEYLKERYRERTSR